MVVIGVTAQIKYVDEPLLHSSASECNCIVNVTLSSTSVNDLNNIANVSDDDDDGFWRVIYKASYMYYSMIGTALTIFFGLVISKISDAYTRVEILKITSAHDMNEAFFRSPAHFSVASFTLATGRKLSSFIHHVAHDVSQSTLKVENKLKEVISHTNLHHLHHGLHGDAEDKISILNEEETDCGVSVSSKSGKGKMFFIGHHDEEDDEFEESLLGEATKPHFK